MCCFVAASLLLVCVEGREWEVQFALKVIGIVEGNGEQPTYIHTALQAFIIGFSNLIPRRPQSVS
jgi:hypothetical protein